jgi:hypothetical protein
MKSKVARAKKATVTAKTKAGSSKTKAASPRSTKSTKVDRAEATKVTKKKGASKSKATVVALTTEERRKLLKPKDQFVEVVERTARALGRRREIRVPGVTTAKLKALTAKAVRAAKREAIVREQFEQKIRPLSDARLLAEDAAYRALLNVYAAVKLYTRADPGVGEEFAFLIEHLTFTREKAEPTPAPERETPPDPG